MRSYHFDCGNSTFGAVGMCGRIMANSKQDAIKKFRRAIEQAIGSMGEIAVTTDQPAVEYGNVYISPENIKLSDIDAE